MKSVEIWSIYIGRRRLRVHPYDSFEKCFAATWAKAGAKLEEIQAVDGVDLQGNATETPMDQVVEAVYEHMNCWGFADTETGDIHIWHKPDCSMAELIHVLSHEQGHLQARTDDEERAADMYGEIAVLSYQMSMKLLGNQRR